MEESKYENLELEIIYDRAMQGNDAEANYQLAHRYKEGIGVNRDREKAAEFYLKAAELGHADAQNIVGCSYFGGSVFKKDEELGIYWLRKSAEQGHVFSQFILSSRFISDNNADIERKEEGFKWLTKAAEQDNVGAQRLLGEFLFNRNRFLRKRLQQSGLLAYEGSRAGGCKSPV